MLLRSGDVHPNPGPKRVTVSTLNVTALLKYAETARSIPSDVVCCQEVSMLRTRYQEAEEKINGGADKWRCLWGAPQLGRKCGVSGVRSTCNAENGGVGTLVRRPIPAYNAEALHDVLGAEHTEGRFLHSLVAVGNGSTFLHVFNVYCPSGFRKEMNEKREALLEKVLFEAQDALGDVPIVVAGDINTDESRSPVLRKALRNLWADAAVLQCRIHGGKPPCTFSNSQTEGTRIDRILLNKIAAQAFGKCETTEVDVPGHRLVTVELKVEAFNQKVKRYKVPRQITTIGASQWSTAEGNTIAAERLEQAGFWEAIQNRETDAAWLKWSKVSEEYLMDAFKTPEELRKCARGHGEERQPVEAVLSARSAIDGSGAASEELLKLRKVILRLEQVLRYLKRKDGPGTVSREVQRCWDNCSRAAWRLAEKRGMRKPESDIKNLPDLEQCQELLRTIREESSEIARRNSAERRKKYRQEFIRRADTDRRSIISWCKVQPKKQGDVVEDEQGRATANVAEVDKMLNESWDPVFRIYKNSPEPQPEPFFDRYRDHIRRNPMREVTKITGAELRAILKKKRGRSACGVDGWRLEELKALPMPLLEALSQVMNVVEETGNWPKALMTALVSMIPKEGGGMTSLDLRPITVTPTVYRLWACRRLADIVKWQERWIESGQHGFRPGHRGEDVLMELGVAIEDALLGGRPLYGLALDFSKCFDRVPRKLVLELMSELGMHEDILRPLRTMYASMTRRFKMSLGVGEEFEVTNGILQGCPISVILINALLSVLMKAVAAEAPGVLTKSYADDANLLSRISEEVLQKGVDVVDLFCKLTGMKLNMEKTLAFSTVPGYQGKLHLGEKKKTFPTSQSVKCLGARICTTKTDRFECSRMEKAAQIAANLRFSPLPLEKKADIVATAVMPAALARCSFAPIQKSAVNQFRVAVTEGIWGSKNPRRAPEAVLGILGKCHLVEAESALTYRIAADFYGACDRLPRLMPMIESVRNRYGESIANPLGPVGVAVKYGLEVCGHQWPKGAGMNALVRNGQVFRPLEMTPAQRGHEMRDDVRAALWDRLAERRESYAGVQEVDLLETNKMWKTASCDKALLARIIVTGAVNTREHMAKFQKKGEIPVADADRCVSCDSGAIENENHIWWECGAYADIRAKPVYAKFRDIDRANWPRCLSEHGVATKGVECDVPLLQSMMVEILERRGQSVRQELGIAKRTPWERSESLPATRHTFQYGKLQMPSTWTRHWKEEAFTAVTAWLSNLEWTSSGDVTMVELSVDYELFSGLNLRASEESAPLSKRGDTLRRMLLAVEAASVEQGLGRCMPYAKKKQATALSFIGIKSLGGVTPRPRFTARETGEVIIQLRGKKPDSFRPDYPVSRGNPARWDLRAPSRGGRKRKGTDEGRAPKKGRAGQGSGKGSAGKPAQRKRSRPSRTKQSRGPATKRSKAETVQPSGNLRHESCSEESCTASDESSDSAIT